MSNQSVQRTGASRSARVVLVAQWRLAPAADAYHSAVGTYHMKICKTKRPSLAGSAGIMDHLVTVVQVAGIAVTIVVLKRFTPLPFWACCLIGFPFFIAVLWGTLYLLSRRHR
jgi:hypothetical protein